MGSVSMLSLLARVVVSLGVVIVLMRIAARMLGQGGLTRGSRRRAAPIEVVSRHMLNRRASIALVRTVGRGFVLGVTDTHVTLLAETDPENLNVVLTEGQGMVPPAGSVVPASPAWKAALDALREKTIRRP